MDVDLDQVQFGRLIQAVETLTNQVSSLNGKVAALETQMTGGRGIVIGLMVAAGGIGAATHRVLEVLLR